MVKGNIILEGNGPSKERVPNGLQNDSTNGSRLKIGDQSVSQAKSKTLICSKLSHERKIWENRWQLSVSTACALHIPQLFSTAAAQQGKDPCDRPWHI